MKTLKNTGNLNPSKFSMDKSSNTITDDEKKYLVKYFEYSNFSILTFSLNSYFKIKLLCIFIFIFCLQFLSYGQAEFNSIKSIKQIPKSPSTSRLMAKAMLARNFSTLKLDSALLLVNEAKKEAVNIKFSEGLRLAQAVELDLESTVQDYSKILKSGKKLLRETYEKNELLTASIIELAIGRMYFYQSNLDSANRYFQMGFNHKIKVQDHYGLINSYNMLAVTSRARGDMKNAIYLCFKAIRVAEKYQLTDTRIYGYLLNTLATIYYSEENEKQCLVWLKKCLEVSHKTNDIEFESLVLGNMAISYSNLGELNKAIKYEKQALEIAIKLDNKSGQLVAYEYLCSIYMNKKDFTQTKLYLEKYKNVIEQLNYVSPNTNYEYHNTLSEYYEAIGKYQKAFDIAQIQYKLAQEMGEIHALNRSTLVISELAAKLKKFEMAYEFHLKYISYKDSISNDENHSKLLAQDMKLKDEQNKAQQQRKKLEYQAELGKQRIIRNTVLFVLLLIGGFAIQIFRSYRLKSRANKLLAEQNQIIEEKNGLITESIEYAKTIQEAMVTSTEYFQSIFSDHFVLFKPKDIVSGDFYWAYKDQQSGRIFWAAADCTGHGVPGALMTMVGISLLNEIVVENSISEPADILNKLRELVIKTLNKETLLEETEKMRNGMDIALCCYDPSLNAVLFAGANNPMIVVRGNELLEFKGTKEPIGIYRKMTPFEQIIVPIKEGDLIYLFSDGFADQMNEENQRFKLANLKKTLLEITEKNFLEQKEHLDDIYENWKAKADQIDDVVFLGVRI